jgi:hypothetical protein
MKRVLVAASWLLVIVGAVCVVSLAGCGDDDDDADTPDSGHVILADAAADADPLAPDADPLAPDASTLPNPDGAVGVACGEMTCTGTDQCCVTQAQGGASYECIAADAECTGGGTLTCDGPEDCGGDACCGAFGGGGAGAACGDGPACSGNAIQLCHNQADCAGTQPCCTSQFGSFCLPFGTTCP